MNALTPTRPALRWHGGKWLLAPWIISHFPAHRVYVEPFGGAASVLLRKERSIVEVYNDLDDEVFGFFGVLRDRGQAERLIELLRLTPFSRREYELSYQWSEDPIEQARRLAVRSYMGFGSNAHASSLTGRGMIGFRSGTGFRANSDRSGGPPARDWSNYPDALIHIIERFAGVIVEGREAIASMLQHDGPQVLHYVDPPYVPETRVALNYAYGKKGMYRHELDGAGHTALLTHLRALSGMVVLSGYPHPMYDDALPDWRRVERAALADGARPRTEVLWINPACAAALDREKHNFHALMERAAD